MVGLRLLWCFFFFWLNVESCLFDSSHVTFVCHMCVSVRSDVCFGSELDCRHWTLISALMSPTNFSRVGREPIWTSLVGVDDQNHKPRHIARSYTNMSGRQGGKAKPLKAPKKQNKELDEDVSTRGAVYVRTSCTDMGC